jgi:hypothetical protein
LCALAGVFVTAPSRLWPQVATEPTSTWALDQATFKKTLMATTMKKRR